MKIEQPQKPGDVITDVLAVDNSGALDKKRFEVKIVDWYLDDKGEIKYSEPGQSQFSIAQNITVSPMQFTCLPGEKKLLRYTLKVPAEIQPGEHYAGIQVLEMVIPPKDPATGKINVGVAVKCGFLTAISIEIPKREVQQVEPVSLNFQPDAQGKEKNVVLSVKNDSNIKVRPLWSFDIQESSGKSIYSSPPLEYILLRSSKRDIAVPVKMALPAGNYKIVGKLDQGRDYPVQELEKEFSVATTSNTSQKPANAN